MGLRDRLRDAARLGRPELGDTATRQVPGAPYGLPGPSVAPSEAWAERPAPTAVGELPRTVDVDVAAARDDLAGLLLEMARLGRFNHPLLERRAHEVLELARDQAARETAAVEDVARRSTRRGRRVASAGLARCPACQAAVPADANFCAYCGTTLETPR